MLCEPRCVQSRPMASASTSLGARHDLLSCLLLRCRRLLRNVSKRLAIHCAQVHTRSLVSVDAPVASCPALLARPAADSRTFCRRSIRSRLLTCRLRLPSPRAHCRIRCRPSAPHGGADRLAGSEISAWSMAAAMVSAAAGRSNIGLFGLPIQTRFRSCFGSAYVVCCVRWPIGALREATAPRTLTSASAPCTHCKCSGQREMLARGRC
jgi:hypothetical protein